MEEDISIINSTTRQEKVRNFFINNKNIIISTDSSFGYYFSWCI
jgi:hypothetical protein